MIPELRADIERRLLVNYRVDPDVVARLLPPGMRPAVVHGYGVAGICLIRLGHTRPVGLPAWLGLRSESAAHRVAVEWDTPGGLATGVYIARRDTASVVNVLAGGRLYPGAHHRATFDVAETDDHVRVAYASTDQTVDVLADVTVTSELRSSLLFASTAAASAFFEGGSVGYSPGLDPSRLEGLQLRTDAWTVEAAQVNEVRSSFFDDPVAFPRGTAELDCALLMRGVPVTWRREPARSAVAAQ